MRTPLKKDTVVVTASLAGYAMNDENAARVARAIGPALLTFAAVEGTLPFAAEPARFMPAQKHGCRS